MSQTVEELRARLLGYDPVIDIDDEGNLKDAGVVPHCIGIIPAEIDSLIAAVIQAERRRILDASLFQFGMGDGTYMMIRTSVVDPKEGEKK